MVQISPFFLQSLSFTVIFIVKDKLNRGRCLKLDISKRIEFLMKEKKLSQRQLALQSKVPYTTLVKILNGVTSAPNTKTLVKIAEFFGKPTDYFLKETVTSLIEERLAETGRTMNWLATEMKLNRFYFENLDNIVPCDSDYELMDKVAHLLKMNPVVLKDALARQEPDDVPDRPHTEAEFEEDWSAEEWEQIEAFKKFLRSQRGDKA